MQTQAVVTAGRTNATGAPERPGCRLSRLCAVSITTRSHLIEPASLGVDDYQDFAVPPT